MSEFKAAPGQTVYQFSAELLVEAWKIGGTVTGEFNQYTLIASPGMTREQVLRPWNEGQRASYFNR